MKSIIVTLFVSLIGLLTYGQKIPGRFYMEQYSPEDYGGGSVVWEIAQDNQDRIYFGLSGQMTMFDGQDYSHLEVDNNTTVRSLDADDQGRVYVGAKGEFGYLEADSTGSMQYHNLSKVLTDSLAEFKDVWNTYVTDDGVFFLTFHRAYRYHEGQITAFGFRRFNAHLGFEVRGSLYLTVRDHGLMRFNGQAFEDVPGTAFQNGFNLFGLMPYGQEELLLMVRGQGMFRVNPITGDTATFHTEIDSVLTRKAVYHATALSDGRLAIATLDDGAYVLSNDGKLIAHFTEGNGLGSSNVKYCFEDRHQGLWLGTALGACRIDLSLPLTWLSTAEGLKGIVRDMKMHHDTLWIASEHNIYYFDPSRGEEGRCIPINDVVSPVWGLVTTEEHLLAASSLGLLEVKASGVKAHSSVQTFFGIHHSTRFPENIYLLGKEGLQLIRIQTDEQGQLQVNRVHRFSNYKVESHHVAEDEHGNLYIVTGYDYAIRVDHSALDPAYTDTTLIFEEIHSEEPLEDVPAYIWNQKVYFAGKEKLLELDIESGEQRMLTDFPAQVDGLPESFRIAAMFPSIHGHLWLHNVADPLDGFLIAEEHGLLHYGIKPSPLLRIPEKVSNSPVLLENPNGPTWIGGNTGVVRYDHQLDFKSQWHYQVGIRRITLNDDSVLFHDLGLTDEKAFKLPFAFGKISIQFAARWYANPEATEYQYRLEGYDDWSVWSSKPEAIYTNLDGGNYRFSVRARNVYGEISLDRSFNLEVASPWYQQWWAYVIYGLAIFFVVTIGNRMSTKRLLRKQRQLELMVQERTRAIALEKQLVEEKNDEILTQSELIAQVNSELSRRNKDVTDSINYALKIQKALLPDPLRLKIYRPESFIFNRPRDIVSGDFYWFEKVGNHLILAVADCTGHGVPGAFMSMICTTLLDKVVRDKQVDAPQDALRLLDQEVVLALSQEQSGNEHRPNDGMDIGILTINLETGSGQYAGAHRPLYCYRDGELLEYKGARASVGGRHVGRKDFAGHELQLQKGDTLYLFSDGYPDQFGGDPKKVPSGGKKYKTKRFKQFLKEISSLPLDEQATKLENEFQQWQGEFQQTDDVLVVAIRI